MPKLIEYPRTAYSGAWELSEIVDDTGGKCAIETAARKLNRKVSGSFKAIIGSAVKFGILTSKRDLLTTTTLFKRIKHAYDKQEELLFHREAFLTPPLFTQLCRKFRSKELPVQMLDVMLIRELGVEEINAQGVAKAFVDGCRMVGLLDEHNIIADIDALNAKQAPRREMANRIPATNSFRDEQNNEPGDNQGQESNHLFDSPLGNRNPLKTEFDNIPAQLKTDAVPTKIRDHDAITALFGLTTQITENEEILTPMEAIHPESSGQQKVAVEPNEMEVSSTKLSNTELTTGIQEKTYHIQVGGPGVSSSLTITDVEDIDLAIALLEKIRRQLQH